MRSRLLLVTLVVACGRMNFDDARRDEGLSSTADQDGDGIPDETDNCPAQFNQSQADADGDKVGDACDPRPTTAGDVLVARGLFASGFGDWVPDTIANWMFANKRVNTTAMPDATLARISVLRTVTNPTVLLGFVVADYGVPFHKVDITIDDPSSTWICRMNDSTAGGPLDTLISIVDAVVSQLDILPSTVPVGSFTTVKFTHEAPQAHCTVASATVVSGSVPTTSGLNTVTIEIRGLSVALDYAMLYDHP